MAENGQRRIRLGMVGGGTGAFIGYVHRIASRLDGDYELVAGALSSRPEVARESGKNVGLAPDRIYTSYEEMADLLGTTVGALKMRVHRAREALQALLEEKYA